MNIEELEKQKNEAYKEYVLALNAWKSKKREEFLQSILQKCKQENREDVIDAISLFGAIAAYPQTDIFIYEGYRSLCCSVIFKNEQDLEKALITYSDSDFDIDTIDVNSANHSVLLSPFEGDDYEEFPFLQCVFAPEDLYEICEKKK